VAPAPADERGPERPRRVHRGAVERAAGEDVRAQDEADGEGRDRDRRRRAAPAPVVHRGGVHGVHEPERHDGLQQERVPLVDAADEPDAHGTLQERTTKACQHVHARKE